MSPRRTVSHLKASDAVRYLEGRVSSLTDLLRMVEAENDTLRSLLGSCRVFDVGPVPCDICGDAMEWGGDFARCRPCGRVYQRVEEWVTVTAEVVE